MSAKQFSDIDLFSPFQIPASVKRFSVILMYRRNDNLKITKTHTLSSIDRNTHTYSPLLGNRGIIYMSNEQ